MKPGFLPPKVKTHHFWARKGIIRHPDKRKAGAQNSTAHPGKMVIENYNSKCKTEIQVFPQRKSNIYGISEYIRVENAQSKVE